MLDSTKLTDFCASFFGYGQWCAPVWFVGIEEAGGRTESAVADHLDTWHKGGRGDLEFAPEFYSASGNAAWHGKHATPQPTWAQLIRMLLIAQGKPDSPESILAYQRNKLGAANGGTCLLELFPLPSPNTAEWNYNRWSDIAWFRSRESYIANIRAGRENELRRRIQAHHPRVVIFYGLELPGGISLLPSWSSIAGGPFEQAIADQRILLQRQTGNTLFFVTRHPAAESDDYFREIGRFFRKNHGKQFELC